MSQRPRGLLALPLTMATCLLAGLLIALLAGPTWQPAAWLLLTVPLITLASLAYRAISLRLWK
jgi:hypothetical protein